MRKLQRILILSIFFAGMCLLDSQAHEGHNDSFGKGATSVSQTEKIEISDEGEKAIGIKLEQVALSNLDQYIEVTGQVKATDKGHYDLSSPISGLVTKVLAKEGDHVKQGQTLATIQSLEATNLLKDLLNQKASLEKDIAILSKELEVNKVSFEREQTLFKEGISSRKDFLNAESSYENSKVSLEATEKQLDLILSTTKSQLKIMGIPDSIVNQTLLSGHVISNVSISAPITGTVSFRNLTPGETIQPEKKIFSIVNLSPIWIIVDVYQEQIPFVKEGLAVSIISSSGEEIKGKVSSVGATIDPQKRTLPVRIVSDNTKETLKPGMTVTAEIFYGKNKEQSIVIPGSALLEEEGRSFVYVKYDTFYQAVLVTTGLRTASKVEILDGLYEGDVIVTRGAKQLKAHALLSSKEPEHDHKAPVSKPQSNMQLLWLGILIGLIVSAIFSLVFIFKSKTQSKGESLDA